MSVETKELHFDTQGEVEIIDITEKVNGKLRESEIEDGIVTVFVPGATGAITTIEYEPGLLQDLPNALDGYFLRVWDMSMNIDGMTVTGIHM